MTPPTPSGPRVLYISGPFSHPDRPALVSMSPHLHLPGRYLALTAEVATVRGGTRDICKVVSAPKGDEYAAD